MNKSLMQFFSSGSKFFLFAVFLFSCREEPILWETKTSDQLITQYVKSFPEFSEFGNILESVDLISLLSVRGPFTLFLPSDTEMKAYYAFKGVSSYKEFSPEFLKQLALYHLVPIKIETDDIGLGALRDTNALGDYLVTEFDGSDIVINKNCKIIKRNIQCANGVIHLIDRVIDPVTINVYNLLANNPAYSLFAEGLKRTRLRDTLQIVSFPYGRKNARTRFTVLAVPDTTFNRYGITNIDQLISRYTDAPDNVTSLENGFYRYMEYHCLAGTFFLNNMNTRIYPILSYDNNISVTVDNDYKLNLDTRTKKYTGFVIDQSNNPAKNGTVHTINDLLPVFEPEPVQITWETTDHFDMRQGDYFGKYYMRWFDGENTFANIKWEGDYLLYYFKPSTESWNLNGDCLCMSGWGWIEVTTPKIMKGKYRVSGNIWNGSDKSNYEVSIDGVATALVTNTQPAITTSWGEFDWSKTETHKVKIIAKTPGLIFWDTVVFTPLK
jgi:uncharacterized surface protein with fasciclin (FAS1) repeats